MTGWLWFVGVLAMVWPIVWTYLAEGNMLKNIEIEVRNHERSSHTDDLNASVDALRRQVGTLIEVIERNDMLLAALWDKSCGHDQSEGGFTDQGYVATTHDRLREAWGVRPNWLVETDQVTFTFNYPKRAEPYPWSSHTPSLRDGENS